MKKLDGRSKKARALKAQFAKPHFGDAVLKQEGTPYSLDPEIIAGGTGVTGRKYAALDVSMPTQTVLQEAHGLIYSDREAQYGHPRVNLGNIAGQWSLYLNQRHEADVILSAEDVCWMMAQVKMCREYAAPKRDSLIDAAGYIALIERVRE